MGDRETLLGALNRARHLVEASTSSADLYVAIEGGVGDYDWALADRRTGTASSASAAGPADLECFAWAVVRSGRTGAESRARSASFLLPRGMTRLILEEGLELGAADDRVTGRVASGKGSGTVGHLTKGLINREAYYVHPVCLALVPWITPELYGDAGFEPL
jgi:inosine/xanthosine triphosphatase